MGSYNFNNLLRHEIDNCDVVVEQTVGVIRPKTFGGYNGDVSRHNIKEYVVACRQQEMEKHKIEQWNSFLARRERFANRHKGIPKHKTAKN